MAAFHVNSATSPKLLCLKLHSIILYPGSCRSEAGAGDGDRDKTVAGRPKLGGPSLHQCPDEDRVQLGLSVWRVEEHALNGTHPVGLHIGAGTTAVG